MEIMRGYGLGSNLQMILQRFWGNQVVVLKAGKLFGRPFWTERGVTQGYQVSSTIFNIKVYKVVISVLLGVYIPQEANHGLGWAAVQHNIVLYTDDGRIAVHNPICVHMTLTAVVSMFEMVGLQTNLGKTKAMVCTPSLIWG